MQLLHPDLTPEFEHITPFGRILSVLRLAELYLYMKNVTTSINTIGSDWNIQFQASQVHTKRLGILNYLSEYEKRN